MWFVAQESTDPLPRLVEARGSVCVCPNLRNSGWGQLGDGTTTHRSVPGVVEGGHVFDSVVAGRGHTAGRTVDGRLLAWGSGGNGETGDGDGVTTSTPVPASGGHRYSSHGGTGHTVYGIRTSGALTCWGRNNTGQVGDGTVTCTSLSQSCLATKASPSLVAPGETFGTVSGGARISNGWGGGSTCAVTTEGTGFCWGMTSSGQLGEGSTTQFATPVPVSGGQVWDTIDVGSAAACGLVDTGQVFCWGYGGRGIIGDGARENRSTPAAVSAALLFDQISVGFDHACGLTDEGGFYCWGANSSGQLRDGTAIDRDVPWNVALDVALGG